ncbi:MAG: hypothetical protein HY788_02605 [Deltaproteobacteria bacterium]|nr:hypothetical protein [Deltaproteobacteria bacterium]
MKKKRFPDPEARGEGVPFWDRDPAIKAMRRVFKNLERWEERKLRKLQREHIPTWDPKLRRVHERAVRLHTRVLKYLARNGVAWTHDLYEELFMALFDHALAENGIYAGVPFQKSRCRYKVEIEQHLFGTSREASTDS